MVKKFVVKEVELTLSNSSPFIGKSVGMGVGVNCKLLERGSGFFGVNMGI